MMRAWMHITNTDPYYMSPKSPSVVLIVCHQIDNVSSQ